jgi:hypothetical protein
MVQPPFGEPGVCPMIVLISYTTNQFPIGGFFSTTSFRLRACLKTQKTSIKSVKLKVKVKGSVLGNWYPRIDFVGDIGWNGGIMARALRIETGTLGNELEGNKTNEYQFPRTDPFINAPCFQGAIR